MSSTSTSSSTKRSNDELSSYDSDIQLLEGMPTKIRRLTFENDALRQERAKDKLQLAAKDSVIAILVASLKKPDGDVAPAPAAAPVPIVAPAVVAPAIIAPAPVAPAVVKPTTVNVATSPVLVPAPAKQRTTTPVVAAAAPKPVAAPVVAAAPKKPVPAPVAAPVVVAKKAATVAAPAAPVPKQLKLQHPAVAVPDDECSEYGEEEEEASPAPAVQMTEEEVVPEEEEEDEDEDLQVVSVKYHSAKDPKDFFYVASTQNLYRINYDEDGEQEVGDLVATYDLAAKKITQRFAAL